MKIRLAVESYKTKRVIFKIITIIGISAIILISVVIRRGQSLWDDEIILEINK